MKSSILIETTTREYLKKLGKKDQTYDEIIQELIKIKTKNDCQNIIPNPDLNHS